MHIRSFRVAPLVALSACLAATSISACRPPTATPAPTVAPPPVAGEVDANSPVDVDAASIDQTLDVLVHPPTQTVPPMPTLDAAVLPTTAAIVGAAGEVGGIKLATCEYLGADGGLEFTTGIYVGMVVPAIKGEAVAGQTVTLSDAEKDMLRTSLRGLKDADGKFCGVVDDPGGWE